MSIEEVRSYINTIRRDFANREFNEDLIDKDPYKQFAKWFEDAVGVQVPDPYAMHIATVNKNGEPSARVVYMRDIDNGFIFYTNYNSQKGKNLNDNKNIAATFYWVELDRQIRFTGKVEKVSTEMSDTYFKNRPFISKIGAIASSQSDKLKNRAELEERVKYLTEKFKDKEVPRPENWGGYRIIPTKFEFWQGRPNRLHDRICYEKVNEKWEIYRINP